MRIKTTYDSQVDTSDSPIHYHFKKGGAPLVLEMEVIGIEKIFQTDKEDFYWTISQDGIMVDINDSTKGLKAQLVLNRCNAGSRITPSIIAITTFNKKGKEKAKKTILLSTDIEVTSVSWFNKENYLIQDVDYKENVNLEIQTFGLNNAYINVHFFTEYDKNSPAYKAKINTGKHKLNNGTSSFVFSNNFQVIPFIGSRMNSIILDKTRLKIFLRIYDKEFSTLLYDGFEKNEFLTIYGDNSIIKRSETTQIEEVIIIGDHDPYFSQKYEPCFYDTIEIKEEGKDKTILFDSKSNKVSNLRQTLTYNIRAKSKEEFTKRTIITVNPLTDKCQNKYHLNNSEISKNLRWKVHENAVFDFQDTELPITENVKDKEIEISPIYRYEYESEDWSFFLRYFIFSTILPTKSNTGIYPLDKLIGRGLELVKENLIKQEIDAKDFAQTHKINIATCRHQHDLRLNLVPDLAWAFHYNYGGTVKDSEAYFKNVKSIHKENGLDEEIESVEEIIRQFHQFTRFIPMFPLSNFGSKEISLILLGILKEMAKEYAFGFQAYYNFDAADKPQTIIDFTKNNPWLGKVFVAGALTIQVLIEILLCILTEGASAARYLVKLRKLKLVKFTGKIEKIVDKAEKVPPKAPIVLNAVRSAEQYFAALTFSGYKAYEFLGDTNEAGSLQVEDRLIFSILEFKHEISNLTLGEIAYNMTPVGVVINTTQLGLDWIAGMQANMNLFHAGKKFFGNKKKRTKYHTCCL